MSDPQHISDPIAEATRNKTTTPGFKLEPSGWRPKLDEYEPSLKAASSACAQFVADMESDADPYWLTLTGINGCGKTHLGWQIYAEARRINPGERFSIWPPDFMERYERGVRTFEDERPYALKFSEYSFAKRLRDGEFDLPERLKSDFFVWMDELGAARDPTNFVSDAMSRLADMRLGKWMLWCTNLTVQELRDRIDARLASRLIRDRNKVIKITAGDYALRKR